MVKAIDLRIGNWVDIPGKGFTQIRNGTCIDTAISNGATPIPLNPILLLALGFDKRVDSEIYDINKSNFAYHLGVRRVLVFHPGNEFWHWLGTHIDHVSPNSKSLLLFDWP